MTEFKLLGIVRHRLRLLTFPMRACGVHPQVNPEVSLYRSQAAWPVRMIDRPGGPTRWELPEISCASST